MGTVVFRVGGRLAGCPDRKAWRVTTLAPPLSQRARMFPMPIDSSVHPLISSADLPYRLPKAQASGGAGKRACGIASPHSPSLLRHHTRHREERQDHGAVGGRWTSDPGSLGSEITSASYYLPALGKGCDPLCLSLSVKQRSLRHHSHGCLGEWTK